MLRTVEGRRLKANGFRSLAAVKAQFRKAGHVPGLKDDLEVVPQLHTINETTFRWHCSCGAELRFTKTGNRFNRLWALEPPIGD